MPIAGLATYRPRFQTGINSMRVPDDPDTQRMASARARSQRERTMMRSKRFTDMPSPPSGFATWRGPSRRIGGGTRGGGGGGGGVEAEDAVPISETLIRGERRGRESPVPPRIRALDTRFITRDGGTIELRRFPWPSDRPHRADACDGSARGEQLTTRRAKIHAVHLRDRPPPRLQYPPGYGAHVPRIKINVSAVGKTAGDNSEEYLCKRVMRGTGEKSHLAPILPDVPRVPESVSGYRKHRLDTGRDNDKAALRREFSKSYRSGNAKLENWAAATGDTMGGTLKTTPRLRNDPNATPFPEKPRYH
jgi:hypothetical protein